MSIQWTIAAGFLYAEIAVVLLLVLPIASPRRWQKVFNSRYLNVLIGGRVQFLFWVLLCTLVLLLLDAVREMRKYSNVDSKASVSSQLDLEMQSSMRMFRAQRNFYISGFSLFLSLVIRRLVILISSLASAQAQSEASLRQAQGASTTARNLLAANVATSENASNEAHDKEVTNLKKKISDLEGEVEKVKKDRDAVKKQAESTNSEYDRLTAEFSKLQKKVDASDDKKDD